MKAQLNATFGFQIGLLKLIELFVIVPLVLRLFCLSL